MGKTAGELSTEERRSFRTAEVIKQRKADQQKEMLARRDAAWDAARRAAMLLKSEFGASRVVVFGSLAHGDWFTPWSDIDLAAWGIAATDFYRAVAAVIDVGQGVEIDLVDPGTCNPRLRATIEREGVEL